MWRAWQINERGADYLQHPKWSILIIGMCCKISCCCPGMRAISFLICFKNKFLNTTKVAIVLILTKCPTPATRQERLVWEVQSQREFVVRVLGREVLAPPCASWLTRHPERDPLPLLLLLLLPTTTMSWKSNVAFFVVGTNLLALYLTKYYIP